MKEKQIFSTLQVRALFIVDPLRMFSHDCLVSLQLKMLLRCMTLVMNTVNIGYSRVHTDIACTCRAVIAIGAIHMIFLTVETKIIAGI